jgi:membrane protein
MKRSNESGSDELEPQGPTDLPKASLWAVLKRSRAEFRNDHLTTLAAALTYYGVLAMVPGLLVLFTALGFFGRHVTQKVAAQVNHVAPGSAGHFVQTLLHQAQSHKAGTGITAIIGLVIALWSASSYVNGFRQASNVIYGIGEGRPFWKTVSIRLAVTVFAVVILMICAVIVVVSGSIANEVGNAVGAGHTAVLTWSIAKWPALLVLVSLLLAVLFWASPNAKQGGLIATVMWLIVSALFAVYVANFSSYNKTYGPLAGIVVFLIWLWLSNIAILLGAEVNAELDHAKAVADGLPPDVRPFAVPRDTKKLDESDKQAVREAQALRR